MKSKKTKYKIIKKIIKEVKSKIAKSSFRNGYLISLKEQLDQYASENNFTTEEELLNSFGSINELINIFNTKTEKELNQLALKYIKRLLFMILISIVLSLIIIFLTFILIDLIGPINISK